MTKTPEQTINEICEDLERKGMILLGHNFCFAMSEIVQHQLKTHGIESRLVECQLTFITKSPPMLKLIGSGHSQNTEKSFDAHMVVITDTEPEYLIDLSQGVRIVLPVEIDSKNHLRLATYDDRDIAVWYKENPEPEFPPVYNQNSLARMRSERDIRNNLKWLKIIVITLLTVSSINAVRGFYDFYQVYVINNNWGPESISRQELYDRVDQLDHKLDQLIERQRR